MIDDDGADGGEATNCGCDCRLLICGSEQLLLSMALLEAMEVKPFNDVSQNGDGSSSWAAASDVASVGLLSLVLSLLLLLLNTLNIAAARTEVEVEVELVVVVVLVFVGFKFVIVRCCFLL